MNLLWFSVFLLLAVAVNGAPKPDPKPKPKPDPKANPKAKADPMLIIRPRRHYYGGSGYYPLPGGGIGHFASYGSSYSSYSSYGGHYGGQFGQYGGFYG